MDDAAFLRSFARCLDLASVLEHLRRTYGGYELVAHWQQGEFHHDVVIALPESRDAIASPVLVVATNCNGGVKEILALEEVPERYGLWHARCPENPEFSGRPPRTRESLRTEHWFDPCELLTANARSELRPEFRERQLGGGWTCSRKD